MKPSPKNSPFFLFAKGSNSLCIPHQERRNIFILHRKSLKPFMMLVLWKFWYREDAEISQTLQDITMELPKVPVHFLWILRQASTYFSVRRILYELSDRLKKKKKRLLSFNWQQHIKILKLCKILSLTASLKSGWCFISSLVLRNECTPGAKTHFCSFWNIHSNISV